MLFVKQNFYEVFKWNLQLFLEMDKLKKAKLLTFI